MIAVGCLQPHGSPDATLPCHTLACTRTHLHTPRSLSYAKSRACLSCSCLCCKSNSCLRHTIVANSIHCCIRSAAMAHRAGCSSSAAMATKCACYIACLRQGKRLRCNSHSGDGTLNSLTTLPLPLSIDVQTPLKASSGCARLQTCMYTQISAAFTMHVMLLESRQSIVRTKLCKGKAIAQLSILVHCTPLQCCSWQRVAALCSAMSRNRQGKNDCVVHSTLTSA